MTAERPRLGVSACLLGREVRHDGRHKRSDFVVDRLAPDVDVVAVCPEVEIGLPVPRPTLQLVGQRERPRMIEGVTGADRTDAMNRWADGRVAELAGAGLDGFLLKARSPSCGLLDVPVRSPAGMSAGSGLFAAALRRALPALPVAQEAWLDDAELRHGFLVRLFTHARLRSGLAAGGPAALPSLHSAHRLLLAAADAGAEAELAQLADRAAAEASSQLAGRYVERAMAALARPGAPSRTARAAHAGADAAARLQAAPYPAAIAPR